MATSQASGINSFRFYNSTYILDLLPPPSSSSSFLSLMMNTFLLLIILLLSFVVLLLAFFALSSCLGDEIRAAWSGRQRNTVPTTFGLQYARMMGGSHSSGQASWESIEMQDMFDHEDDYDDEGHRR